MALHSNRRRSDSGYTAFQVVMYISILLSLATVVYWILLLMRNYNLKEHIAQLEARGDIYEQKLTNARTHGENLARLIGSRSEENFSLSKLTPQDVAQTRKLATEDFEFLRDKNLTLHQVALLLDNELRWELQRLMEIRTSLARIQERVDTQEKKKELMGSYFQTRITSLQNRQTTLDRELRDIEAEIEKVEKQNEDQLEDLEQKKAEIEEKLRTQISDLENDILDLKGDIEDLQAREARVTLIRKPDGEVLDGSADGSWAYINIGREDRVRPGVKFMVYRPGRGDRRITKGQLEVKQVFDDFSRCEVSIRAPDTDPIMQGDKIINPIFSTDQKKIFALAGTFPAGVYHVDKESLKLFIEKAQAEVVEEVDVDTNFLIHGQEYEETENYKKAQEIGIPTIDVKRILQFLGH